LIENWSIEGFLRATAKKSLNESAQRIVAELIPAAAAECLEIKNKFISNHG
jgi:hypothetical protein